MNLRNTLPFFLLLLSELPSHAQVKSEIDPLLRQAAYIMNRFDEVATGLDTEIDNWSVDEASKKLFHEELTATLHDSNYENLRLDALLGKNNISSPDLFDVYSNLESVASELQGQASNAANWGAPQTRPIELAQLGSKALKLAANVGFVLRSKIAAQEAELGTCTQKAATKPSASRSDAHK